MTAEAGAERTGCTDAPPEPMTERDHFDFARWQSKLGELADAYYETGRTNPARRRARAALMLHATDCATGWRARSTLAATQATAAPADEAEAAARQAADEAVAAGDGTLHGAIDHWHGVAVAAQAQAAAVSEERDELRAACEQVLALLHKGAPGWGVSKDILAHVLLHRRWPG